MVIQVYAVELAKSASLKIKSGIDIEKEKVESTDNPQYRMGVALNDLKKRVKDYDLPLSHSRNTKEI